MYSSRHKATRTSRSTKTDKEWISSIFCGLLWPFLKLSGQLFLKPNTIKSRNKWYLHVKTSLYNLQTPAGSDRSFHIEHHFHACNPTYLVHCCIRHSSELQPSFQDGCNYTHKCSTKHQKWNTPCAKPTNTKLQPLIHLCKLYLLVEIRSQSHQK